MKEFIIHLGHRRLWKCLASFSRHLIEIYPAKQLWKVIMYIKIWAPDSFTFSSSSDSESWAYSFMYRQSWISLPKHTWISKTLWPLVWGWMFAHLHNSVSFLLPPGRTMICSGGDITPPPSVQSKCERKSTKLIESLQAAFLSQCHGMSGGYVTQLWSTRP